MNTDCQGPYRFDVFSGPSTVEAAAQSAIARYRDDAARLEAAGGEPRIWLPTLRLAIRTAEHILTTGLDNNIVARDEEADLRCDKRSELSRALNRADAAARLLEHGAGPEAVADMRGDVRVAYRSSVDDSDQPFCLFVPLDYDANKRYPLMLRLHGMWAPEIGEDEWCIQSFEWDREFVRYAPRGSFIEVYPYGRCNEGYRDAGLHDVLDSMALAEEFFSIDPDRVYIMGSSMGAAGAWRIAAAYPHLFAAACFVVGVYDRSLADKVKRLPVMFHYGGKDSAERVTSPQETAALLRKLGGAAEVIGHPDSGHRLETTDYQLSYYQFFAKHSK
jgi:poly(3-hydroxybutyrate) depolymerase